MIVCLPISLSLFLLKEPLFFHLIPRLYLVHSIFIATPSQGIKMRRDMFHLAYVVYRTIPKLSYHLPTSWFSELAIWAVLSRWIFCLQLGSVMCLLRASWLLGTDWSRMVPAAKTHFCFTSFSLSSRQAQVVHVKSGQVFKRESRVIKGLLGSKLRSVHCHFHCILLAKTRHKASSDLMVQNVLMEETPSHIARAIDTE